MIDRVCISINNKCNLACQYCHFHEKTEYIKPVNMDVFIILNNIRSYINKYDIPVFKIGFVGNGEPFLDFNLLKNYILRIADLIETGKVNVYTITNGTCVDISMLEFMKEHKVNVGFSLDGPREIHNKYRCNTYDQVISSIGLYHDLYGYYPSLNCTVGREAIEHTDQMISFFSQFDSRITFSRMIGKLGISLNEFRSFMDCIHGNLNVRTGGYDCTMYGGMCGAGINNFFYSNQRIYLCGNCVDLQSLPYDTPLDQIRFQVGSFDRNNCYKENLGI